MLAKCMDYNSITGLTLLNPQMNVELSSQEAWNAQLCSSLEKLVEVQVKGSIEDDALTYDNLSLEF